MFKNLSIRGKLLSNSAPQIVIILVLAVMVGLGQNSVLMESRQVYYEQLKVLTDKLITADRDFYQAQMAIDRLQISGDEEAKQSNIDDYKENKQQVLDGLSEIKAIMDEDEYLLSTFRAAGQTSGCDTILNETVNGITAWDLAYNPNDGSGDYEGQTALFSEARSGINELEDIAFFK